MNIQNRIGIGIVHCITKPDGSAGFDIVFKTDEGERSNLIDDTGDVFSIIRVNRGSIIRMIKFVKDGWYLCSMKPITGRDEEYRASWIFFPIHIKVSASDVKNIMDVVEQNISTREYNGNALHSLVQQYKNYVANSPKYAISSNQHGGYAIRYVGGSEPSLFDVFGNIYQKDFTEYSWVFLMESSNVVDVNSSVEDITSRRLLKTSVIGPIATQYGFEPYVNNLPFTESLRVSDHEKIKVVWKKDGFKNIEKNGYSAEDFKIHEDDIFRIIKRSQFKVCDSNSRRSLTSADINLVGYTFDRDHLCWYVPENKLRDVQIRVAATGYESKPISGIDPKSIDDPIYIYLKKEVHTYRFRVRNNNSTFNEITIEYNYRIQETEEPIKGYRISGDIVESSQGSVDLVFDDNKYYYCPLNHKVPLPTC